MGPSFFGTPPSRSKLIAKAFRCCAFSTGLKRTCAAPFVGFFECFRSLAVADILLKLIRSPRPCSISARDMGTLPVAHFTTCFIEDSFVVFQSHFPGSLCIERIPQRLVLIEDL